MPSMPAVAFSTTVSLAQRMDVGLPKLSPIGQRHTQHSKPPCAPPEYPAVGGPVSWGDCTIDHSVRHAESAEETAVRRRAQ